MVLFCTSLTAKNFKYKPFTQKLFVDLTGKERGKTKAPSLVLGKDLLPSMLLLILCFSLLSSIAQPQIDDFTYNGFLASNMSLGGTAQITHNGLLRLTDNLRLETAYAFYPFPLLFKASTNGSAHSFSTAFVIAIVPQDPDTIGHGITFTLSPSSQLSNTQNGQYLGLLNSSNNGNPSNHIFAVEFDTYQSIAINDIDDNHIGIDNNSIISIQSTHVAYFDGKDDEFKNLTLASGEPIQVWVDYNGFRKQIQVTISPLNTSRPVRPLLSMDIDLSPTILQSMYVGFSAATGGPFVSAHYVLGWSFKMNGQAQMLDLSRLPKLPRIGPKKKSRFLTIGVPTIVVFFVVTTLSAIVITIHRRFKYAEVIEDWEKEYGPHRFSFQDLFVATKGFRHNELLGEGGFGMVYKGVLPRSRRQVAVKRVSHNSKQGVREFVAEIVSLGRLRHRNLVQLLGYCRRNCELLLVYDFMPNGSLNNFLFGQPRITINWRHRYQIIKGVASGLLYLHEEWEQVVLHRDIKASNVLLDSEFNARLGDFGLARLYDHGSAPHTTHVVGTMGYMAPELTKTGKATTSTDVFAFGVFVLEVTCGRGPIEDVILVEWVLECWMKGDIVDARDVRLGSEYVKEEIELVLKLGLLCAHPVPAMRPSMRQVMQILEGECALPDISSNSWKALRQLIDDTIISDEIGTSYSSTTLVESVLSEGR